VEEGGVFGPFGSHQLDSVWMLMALPLTSPSFLTKFASSDTVPDIAAGSVPVPQLPDIWAQFSRSCLTVPRHPSRLSFPLSSVLISFAAHHHHRVPFTAFAIQQISSRKMSGKGGPELKRFMDKRLSRETSFTCKPLQTMALRGIASEPPAFIPEKLPRGEMLLCGRGSGCLWRSRTCREGED